MAPAPLWSDSFLGSLATGTPDVFYNITGRLSGIELHSLSSVCKETRGIKEKYTLTVNDSMTETVFEGLAPKYPIIHFLASVHPNTTHDLITHDLLPGSCVVFDSWNGRWALPDVDAVKITITGFGEFHITDAERLQSLCMQGEGEAGSQRAPEVEVQCAPNLRFINAKAWSVFLGETPLLKRISAKKLTLLECMSTYNRPRYNHSMELLQDAKITEVVDIPIPCTVHCPDQHRDIELAKQSAVSFSVPFSVWHAFIATRVLLF